MSNLYEKIDYGLNADEKAILKEINELEFQIIQYNKRYVKLISTLKCNKTKEKDIPKIEGKMQNIRFACGVEIRKRNKLQEQLYGG